MLLTKHLNHPESHPIPSHPMFVIKFYAMMENKEEASCGEL